MAKKIDAEVKEQIKRKYISTNIDYRSLGKEFGITYQTICKWSTTEDWLSQRKEFMKSVEEQSIVREQERRINDIEDINNEDITNWKLFKQKTLLMLMKTEKPIELLHLSQAYERAQKGIRLALGLVLIIS